MDAQRSLHAASGLYSGASTDASISVMPSTVVRSVVLPVRMSIGTTANLDSLIQTVAFGISPNATPSLDRESNPTTPCSYSDSGAITHNHQKTSLRAQVKASCVSYATRRDDRGGRVRGQLRHIPKAHRTTTPVRVHVISVRASAEPS